MIDVAIRVIAALAVAALLCLSTYKMIGVTQQGGYRNRVFWRWLKRKDNLQYNRLSVLALCLALSTAVVSLCFSFLGVRWATLVSAAPCLTLLVLFWTADRKYALKVATKRTGRFLRLWTAYYFFTALFAYVLIAVLAYLAEWNGSNLYGLVAYVPVAVLPLTLPLWVCVANALMGIFENARNKKFVKRAGQVLNEREILRVAVVGSYGKTSVKNILKTLLSEKYSVVETPASYNTPVGIAKTVFSDGFDNKQVFIAEMGARKQGDIKELCQMVKPDYALFTGVCPQHILTFQTIENILAEKSEILRCGAKKVVCGRGLIGKIEEGAEVVFPEEHAAQNIALAATETKFTLSFGGEKIEVVTKLLGETAVENITLAALLCKEMGLTAKEIADGIAKLQPVEHRLQLIEGNDVYILDDGYNCNIRGAKASLAALSRFSGRKCVVTPGIVEGGILEESLNTTLGEEIAKIAPDKIILVGDTLVGAVKEGYLNAGGDKERVTVKHTLDGAQNALEDWVEKGDAILFLNDLPDAY